jgi:RNA polymerase sigma-70 factor (ECF subfamily)
MIPAGEAELVERARRGDVHAYRDLVRLHERAAFRLAYFITGQREDAEDACQEAFLKAYRALGRFQTGLPFRNWAMRIVANEAHDRRSAAQRAGAISASLTDGLSVPDAFAVEDAVLRAEALRDLLGVWARLDEDDRLVIACRFFLDLSERDTAEVLDLRVGTVKSRLSRALVRLRAEVGGVA